MIQGAVEGVPSQLDCDVTVPSKRSSLNQTQSLPTYSAVASSQVSPLNINSIEPGLEDPPSYKVGQMPLISAAPSTKAPIMPCNLCVEHGRTYLSNRSEQPVSFDCLYIIYC
jgi:hypothetical protein